MYRKVRERLQCIHQDGTISELDVGKDGSLQKNLMALRGQKLKMRCVRKSDAVSVCDKLKAVSKLNEICMYHIQNVLIPHIYIMLNTSYSQRRKYYNT
jgi:hypothetical protein